MGIRRFGTGIEANALLTWYRAVMGAGRALIGAKAFASCARHYLHQQSAQRHGILTVMYLAAAVWP